MRRLIGRGVDDVYLPEGSAYKQYPSKLSVYSVTDPFSRFFIFRDFYTHSRVALVRLPIKFGPLGLSRNWEGQKRVKLIVR